ncbi:MAG: hypothetical protein NTX79_04460 [Candidatus Micrarchaeota archaeon]|nr:hypothetical protein [Candidatus Micrarchaeota archaeon]
MGAPSMLQSALDRSFRSTCRALFGEELGGLQDNEGLFTYAAPLKRGKSALSGAEVSYIAPYPSAAKFISMAEKARLPAQKFSPNDISDIDSLLRAARECAYYCGSKAIGNSKYVEMSDNVTDSFFVYASHNITKSEYIAYSELVIKSKHQFGSAATGESEFCIGISESSLAKRVFESAQVQTCSDLYCCFFARNCHDCMFSFGQQSKRFMIGNNQLERARYMLLKKELLSQMAGMLRSRKKGLKLSEIVGGL